MQQNSHESVGVQGDTPMVTGIAAAALHLLMATRNASATIAHRPSGTAGTVFVATVTAVIARKAGFPLTGVVLMQLTSEQKRKAGAGEGKKIPSFQDPRRAFCSTFIDLRAAIPEAIP